MKRAEAGKHACRAYQRVTGHPLLEELLSGHHKVTTVVRVALNNISLDSVIKWL